MRCLTGCPLAPAVPPQAKQEEEARKAAEETKRREELRLKKEQEAAQRRWEEQTWRAVGAGILHLLGKLVVWLAGEPVTRPNGGRHPQVFPHRPPSRPAGRSSRRRSGGSGRRSSDDWRRRASARRRPPPLLPLPSQRPAGQMQQQAAQLAALLQRLLLPAAALHQGPQHPRWRARISRSTACPPRWLRPSSGCSASRRRPSSRKRSRAAGTPRASPSAASLRWSSSRCPSAPSQLGPLGRLQQLLAAPRARWRGSGSRAQQQAGRPAAALRVWAARSRLGHQPTRSRPTSEPLAVWVLCVADGCLFGGRASATGEAVPSGNLLKHGFCLPACLCRSDHDSDDDQPKKPVPEWAKGNQLRAQLVAQVRTCGQVGGGLAAARWAAG